MDAIMISVLSSALWDAIKAGAKITGNYLKSKLSNWLFQDTALERLAQYTNEIPSVYLISEGMIAEYIKTDDKILAILSAAGSNNITQNTFINNGNITKSVFGNNNNTTYNNYATIEEPIVTNNKEYLLLEGYSEFHPVPIVKSYSSTRDNCLIENGINKSVYADLLIPNELKQREGCHFAMILFSFIPSENWTNYFDQNYKLSFNLDTSDSIKQIQLQIKNSNQHQFVDFAITRGYFSHTLSELSQRKAFSNVHELCFTIFADDNYILGEKGFVSIKNLMLKK